MKPFLFTGVVLIGGFILNACGPSSSAMPASVDELSQAGRAVYDRNCAGCHQADGNGVPQMQPSLVSNPLVSGDTRLLIRILLQGPARVLPAQRAHFSNVMPPMSRLSDVEIAEVLTYLRQEYNGQASPIWPDQVRILRAQSDTEGFK